MALRRAIDFRNLSVADLREELKRQREGLYKLRYRMVTQQVDDTKAIWKARKEIARILTVLGEKEGAARGEPSGRVQP